MTVEMILLEDIIIFTILIMFAVVTKIWKNK